MAYTSGFEAISEYGRDIILRYDTIPVTRAIFCIERHVFTIRKTSEKQKKSLVREIDFFYVIKRVILLAPPIFSHHLFESMEEPGKSMSWFFTETEEPDGKIRREEIDGIEEILIGERVCSDDARKASEP